MKLLIDNKYKDVDFWSFMKCQFLVSLALTGMIYAGLFLLGLAVTILAI